MFHVHFSGFIFLICLQQWKKNDKKRTENNWFDSQSVKPTKIGIHSQGVPIFVEHWGGIICIFTQFCPIFNIGRGWTSTRDFVQVSKLNEDQKKRSSPKNGTLFSSPNSGEYQKKRSSTKLEYFFFYRIQVDTYAQMHTRVELLGGGCRCRPYSNYWGDTVKLLGGIYPPRVSAPLFTASLHDVQKLKVTVPPPYVVDIRTGGCLTRLLKGSFAVSWRRQLGKQNM